MFRKVLFTFLFGLFCMNMQAGWVITEKTTGTADPVAVYSTIYFQKNTIKTVQEDNATIFDLGKGEITFLNLKEKTFWKGSANDYKREVHKLTMQRIQQELNEIPPGQRENYREFYENLLRDMQNPAPEIYPEVSARVEMTGEQKTFLNYPARRYNIYMEGFLVEEVWISSSIRISGEVDLDKFRLFMNEMSSGNMEPDHRSSQEYLHLLKSGYPLFSREFSPDGEIVTEVIRAESRQIPQTEFQVPAGFQPGTLGAFELF